MSIGIKPFYSIESLAMRLAFMNESINILNHRAVLRQILIQIETTHIYDTVDSEIEQ